MRRLPWLLGCLALLGSPLAARIWTDTQGRTVEAEFLRVADGNVTIRRTDGAVFTLSLEQLSIADREFVAQKVAPVAGSALAAPADFEDLNRLLGVPLFAGDLLWDDPPAEVAKRLGLSPEAQTAYYESYRAYPATPVSVLDTAAYTLSLQALNGKLAGFGVMFTNKGDYPAFKERTANSPSPTPEQMQAFEKAQADDVATLTGKLSSVLGPARKEFPITGLNAGHEQLRWDWHGHSLILVQVHDQYVSLKIVPPQDTAAGALSYEQVRKLLKTRITKRANGDVILNQIPMITQGPKGYCVPATFERYLRYVNIPADMYELAMAGDAGFGGSASPTKLAEGVNRYVNGFGRHLVRLPLSGLNVDSIARYVDEGRPIMWCLTSTKKFNVESNQLSQVRATVSDWAEWKKTLLAASATRLETDTVSNHMCMIIGYNRATNELAFTDSWGANYAERWVPLVHAAQISLDEYWGIDL